MEYKLLRALSFFLQAGLIILLLMLLSLVLFSCKPAKGSITIHSTTAVRKDIMKERFLNEVHQHRQYFKVLCFNKSLNTNILPCSSGAMNENTAKKA